MSFPGSPSLALLMLGVTLVGCASYATDTHPQYLLVHIEGEACEFAFVLDTVKDPPPRFEVAGLPPIGSHLRNVEGDAEFAGFHHSDRTGFDALDTLEVRDETPLLLFEQHLHLRAVRPQVRRFVFDRDSILSAVQILEPLSATERLPGSQASWRPGDYLVQIRPVDGRLELLLVRPRDDIGMREFWLLDPRRVFDLFSQHYETDCPVPETLPGSLLPPDPESDPERSTLKDLLKQNWALPQIAKRAGPHREPARSMRLLPGYRVSRTVRRVTVPWVSVVRRTK